MVKALKIIANFITNNWLILFFLLTLIAVIMFIIIAINCCRTISSSNDIPNARAAAENEYFCEKMLEGKEDHDNENRTIDTNESDYSDLF